MSYIEIENLKELEQLLNELYEINDVKGLILRPMNDEDFYIEIYDDYIE